VKAFIAPKQREAKQTFSEKDKKWAMGMLTQLAQYKMNLPSDYAPKISNQSTKSGKQILLLGEQKNQSVRPLIAVPPISIRPS
jgi:hypothetical protein